MVTVPSTTSGRKLSVFVPSFRAVLVTSSILRIALIVYSEWHDAHSVVKYTDVDYRVFSDAARFLIAPSENNIAQGPLGRWLGLGDPYTRATYRYTPLLAVLLTPNEWLHPSFGKYLFAACDILAGVLIYRLLETTIPPNQVDTSKSDANTKSRECGPSESTQRQATILASVHLLNPMVFTISTRGSSEAVLSLFVLSTLYCALKGKWDTAAVLLGLSTHWKIYPFIYGVGCLGVLGRKTMTSSGWLAYLKTIVNKQTVRFTFLSSMVFAILGAAMYILWGYPFLYESYLYHLHRVDHRHNFSPYFYPNYLAYPYSPVAPLLNDLPFWRRAISSPLASFAPQMIMALGTGLLFGRRKEDLVFTWFVQTVMFVVFNKVCTSQYFLWYLLFIPLLCPQLHISSRRAVVMLLVWTGTQALWLSEAYKLEFLGHNVFLGLWARSLVYVVGNCWVLAEIMFHYSRQ
ncbi:glycosyltransferase family 50 protein [Gelatoporia subvermispora B]|uniref:GPI mannosyltransferase 1 n=1 Tax=Ceriporiopsis subvermispora (strain B) TaxID=914234 RepID=M2QML8_CERS8|nr:glycosyltransferase family 50 protein [Gelatoporia subvermispora B]